MWNITSLTKVPDLVKVKQRKNGQFHNNCTDKIKTGAGRSAAELQHCHIYHLVWHAVNVLSMLEDLQRFWSTRLLVAMVTCIKATLASDSLLCFNRLLGSSTNIHDRIFFSIMSQGCHEKQTTFEWWMYYMKSTNAW